MTSGDSVPWYNRPARAREAKPRVREPRDRKRPPPQARPFPAHRWAQQRYGFLLPPLFFAQPVAHAVSDGMARRPFPAKVWLEGRQTG